MKSVVSQQLLKSLSLILFVAFAEACNAEDVSRMTTILESNSSPTIHVKLVSCAVTEDGLTPLCWYGNFLYLS